MPGSLLLRKMRESWLSRVFESFGQVVLFRHALGSRAILTRADD
jgi:hypothetical protein